MIYRILATTMMAAALLSSSVAFAGRDNGSQLPPGLQKKAARGEALPPGWQKKLEVGHRLDDDIYEYGHVVDTSGRYETLSVEGKIIRVIEDTHEIVDILND